MNFQEKINSIRSKNASTYRMITIDLSIARSEFELAIAGAYIFGFAATDAIANIDIKLNENRNDTIPFSSQKFIDAVFYRLFLTNTAQAGKSITLAIATFDTEFFRVGDLTSGDIATIGEVTEIKKIARQNYITPDPDKFDSWIHEDFSVNGGVAIIYTVPVGKILYIQTCTFNHYSNGGGTIGAVGIRDVADAHQYHLAQRRTDNLVYSSNVLATFSVKDPIPAGYDVYLTGAAGDWLTGAVHGWLEDV